MLNWSRMIDMNTYQTYRNLPALAGICSMDQAITAGLSVEECVRRLKRYHYAFKRLHQTFTARIPAEPIYELKMAFSLHAHLCAEHATALRKRVSEMREPPANTEFLSASSASCSRETLRCVSGVGSL